MFVVLIVSRERGQTAIPSCAVLSQCAGDMSRKFGVLHSRSEEVVCSVTRERVACLVFSSACGRSIEAASVLGNK